ncbi:MULTISPECIES: PPOX class F420-dependent oxidoreductase [unclassified Amycolatopsis]|uniref:PPOX class F420-dependent oxidoreductase n=1 Tax=unclassified Amycolatopsis TaxID=2618356 RepID=UPI002E12B2B3|nr:MULTISPECIES: PPOX class F420-dependent oxidoreductase [unclassified Amycolatopsis]WSJ77521.1 PPOX class F420-dependent oxidoreductase [Amycolatopsis sp. NBC_01307]WSK78906.1 PPOX class F420-dependent oxidoreductase [Amycolatopsis sp. NBC_01286]
MASETDRLAAERYVVLTTFRKDGRAVPTPIWVAGDGGELVFNSVRDVGKVKRIRNSGRVEVQACDLRGKKTHGAVASGQARLLDLEETKRAQQVIGRKYGVVGRVSMFFSKLRGPADRTVGIAVKLSE